jgi:hypothetical protein
MGCVYSCMINGLNGSKELDQNRIPPVTNLKKSHGQTTLVSINSLSKIEEVNLKSEECVLLSSN